MSELRIVGDLAAIVLVLSTAIALLWIAHSVHRFVHRPGEEGKRR